MPTISATISRVPMTTKGAMTRARRVVIVFPF
nr:MAG TPA: hypothetical protein [Caudoviricetes sp.]DAY42477.1 MAG TPA: hypothetical protein [Caudoviricetes sp.]